MPIKSRCAASAYSESMIRSRRRMAAWLGILGIAFAQAVVAAHACVTGAPVHASAARAVAMAHEGHCAGVQGTAPVAPVSNACEVQCTDGAPVTAAPDLPPVMQVAMILPSSPPAVPVEARARDRSVLASSGAAPPRALQFCRLLI
jgi:hypothetical protein